MWRIGGLTAPVFVPQLDFILDQSKMPIHLEAAKLSSEHVVLDADERTVGENATGERNLWGELGESRTRTWGH